LLAAQCPLDPAIGTALPYGGFDYEYPMQAIGFVFPFAGTTYTHIHVTTKGMFYLSNGGVPVSGGYDYSPTTAELVSGSPRICPMWTDMGVDSTSGVYLNSSASECTITWKDARGYGTSLPLFSVQCKLFPSGEIRFSYSTATINNSSWIGPPPGWTAIIGASPGLGAILPAASDLSAGGVTLDNTIYEEFPAPDTFNMGGMYINLLPLNPGWFYSAPPANCATASDYGQGCIQSDDSYHENYATALNMDLTAGKTITMLRSGSGYLVLDAIPGTIVPPGIGAVPVAAGDDVETTVALTGAMPVAGGTTSNLTICSNGQISLAATGNGTSWTPDVPTFMGWVQTVVAVWHDYNNTLPGSGPVMFEQAGGFAYVTWNNVFSYGTAPVTGDTFQWQFELATGNITLVFGTMTPDGNGYLVGYSRVVLRRHRRRTTCPRRRSRSTSQTPMSARASRSRPTACRRSATPGSRSTRRTCRTSSRSPSCSSERRRCPASTSASSVLRIAAPTRPPTSAHTRSRSRCRPARARSGCRSPWALSSSAPTSRRSRWRSRSAIR
jgi:hypothetical protein